MFLVDEKYFQLVLQFTSNKDFEGRMKSKEKCHILNQKDYICIRHKFLEFTIWRVMEEDLKIAYTVFYRYEIN